MTASLLAYMLNVFLIESGNSFNSFEDRDVSLNTDSIKKTLYEKNTLPILDIKMKYNWQNLKVIKKFKHVDLMFFLNA